MESTLDLYECPPFHARMTVKQCAAYRAQAAAPGRRRRLHKARDDDRRPERRECTKCKGVLWWAEHTGRGPKTLCTAEVARGIAEKEEVRRKLACVPVQPPPWRGGDYSDELASLLRSSGRL